MGYRETDISARVNEWLDRFAVPAHLKDKPDAAQKEAEAILRMFLRYAPREDFVPFLNRVFDQIDYQKKTRYWPTPQEVGSVCVNINKESPKGPKDVDAVDMSSEAIMGRRMAKGEAVGEDWLYGRCAVDLIAGGHVSKEVMTAYRSAAFFARKDVYGEEAALEWEAAAKERHEAAREIHRQRNAPKGNYDTSATMKRMEMVE
jgi:hypothetical protein